MATKQQPSKRPGKNVHSKTPALLTQHEQLQRELKALREENRRLKKSLATLLFKDDSANLDLTPEDGMAEPSLTELVAELARAGK